MKAIDYLSQAYHMDDQINSKLEQISRLRSMATKVTSCWEGVHVFHSRNNTSLQDAVVRIMEAEEALNRDIDELVSLKLEIVYGLPAEKNFGERQKFLFSERRIRYYINK